MTRFFSETCLVRGRGRHALAVVAVGLRAPAVPFSPGSGWFVPLAFVSPRRLRCWPRSSLGASACYGEGDEPVAADTARYATTERRRPPTPPPPATAVHVVDGDTGKPVAAGSRRRPRRRGEGDAEGRGGARRPAPPLRGPRLRSGLRRAHGASSTSGAGSTIESSSGAPSLQWPLYGANPARTQAQAAIKVRPPFRIVVAAGDRRVDGVSRHDLGGSRLRPHDGRHAARDLDEERPRSLEAATSARSWPPRPAIDPERGVLVSTSMQPGYVTVRSLETGKLRWRYYTGLTEPSPVIRDGVAYFGATNGNVYALDLDKRKPRWVFHGGVKITSSPALVGNRLYFGDYAGRVFALDARNGRVIWRGSAGGRVYGTVAVAGGRVFAPSVFSGLSALSAKSGRLLWRISAGSYVYSSPAAYRGRVYFGAYNGLVYAVVGRLGPRALDARRRRPGLRGAVQVVDGLVYAASLEGRTSAWNWKTGNTVWTFPHGKYVPVSGSGERLLAPRGDGALRGGAQAPPMTRRRWILAIVALVLLLGAGVARRRLRRLAARAIRARSAARAPSSSRRPRSPARRRGRRRSSARSPGPRTATTSSARATRPASTCARPSRRPGTKGTGSLLEFPPVVAYGRVYVGTNDGRFLAVNAKTGKRRLAEELLPLHRRLADDGRGRHLPAAHGPVPLPGAQAGRGRLHRRDRPRHRARALALRGRRGRDLAARRREPPLLRVLGQEDVRGRREHPQGRLDVPDRRPGEGRPGVRARRRSTSRPTTTRSTPSTRAPGSSAGRRAGPRTSTPRRRSPTGACSSGTRTGASTPSAQDSGHLLWAKATGRLRLLLGRGLAEDGLRRLLQQALLRPRRRLGRRELVVRRGRRDLGCADGARRRRLLLDDSRRRRSASTPRPARSSGSSTTASTARSSPTRSASTSPDTSASTG